MSNKNSQILVILIFSLAIFCKSIEQIPYKDTDIVGRYTFSPTSQSNTSILGRKVEVQIDSSKIKIFGCNQLTASYSYDLGTKIIKIQNFYGTQKACINSTDGFLIKLFTNAKKVYRNGSTLICENYGNKNNLALQFVSNLTPLINQHASQQSQTDTTARNQSSTTNLSLPIINNASQNISGKYKLTLPSLSVQVNESSFSLKACNNHDFQIATVQRKPNAVRFNLISSTQRDCQNDLDHYYLQGFSWIRYRVKIENGYRLLDQNYKLVFQILKFSSLQIQSLSNSYLLSLPSVDFNIDQTSLIFTGCNINSIDYDILSNSQIKLGGYTSTQRFCLFFNYDDLIRQSLYFATQFQWSANALIFKDNVNRTVVYGLIMTNVQSVRNKKYINLVPKISNITETNIRQVKNILSQVNNSQIEKIVENSSLFLSSNKYNPVLSLNVQNVGAPKLSLKPLDPLIQPGQIHKLSQAFPFILSPELYLYDKASLDKPLLFVPSQQKQIVNQYDPLYQQQLAVNSTKIKLISSTTGNVQHTSLQGTYKLQAPGTALTPIFISFDDEYLQFQICNIWRIPYSVYTDGVFVILQGGSSTKRTCSVDNDKDYLSIIKNITRFNKTQSGYQLNKEEKQLLVLSIKIRNQIVKYNAISGGYQLDIPGVDGTVTDNYINFEGCNQISIPYKINTDNTTQFGDPVVSTNVCSRNADGYYINGILKAKKIKQIGEGFVLLDEKDNELLRFVSFFSNRNAKNKYFIGQFSFKLPNQGYRLKISDGYFTLSGCNQFDFKFSLADSGAIIYGNPNSTKAICQIDNDNVFLYSLLKSQNIAVFGKNIVLYNGNNQVVAKLQNFDASGTNSTNSVTIIDPKSPVVRKVEVRLTDGSYTFTVLRSSFKKITLKIIGNTASFKGCNTNNLTYIAASDGTIKFINGASTLIFCRDDYDSYYAYALLSSTKYADMKGMYTFYDAKGQSLATLLYIAPLTSAQQAQIKQTVKVDLVNLTYTNASSVTPIVQKQPIVNQSAIVAGKTSVGSSYQTTQYQQSINIDGKFKLQLPQFDIILLNDSLVIKGCNVYRFPCLIKKSTFIFGKPIISNKNCQDDPNAELQKFMLGLIPQIYTFSKTNSTFTFFNSKLESLFSANLTSPTKESETKYSNSSAVQNKTSSSPLLSSLSSSTQTLQNVKQTTPQNSTSTISSQIKPGSYKVSIPTKQVQINATHIKFRGCKNQGILYRVEKDGIFTYFQNNRHIVCPTVSDQIYQNSIKDATKVRKIDDAFLMVDEQGNQKAKLLKVNS